MRHRVKGRKLGRTTSHRWALFRNMVVSLVTHERIETTLPKAKELRSFADKLITLGKQQNLAARRRVFDFVRSRDVVSKVFNDLAPRFESRQGGYTRVIKSGFRVGDNAPMAYIEYVAGDAGAVSLIPKPKKEVKKKEAKKKDSDSKADKKVVKKKTEKKEKKESKSKEVKAKTKKTKTEKKKGK